MPSSLLAYIALLIPFTLFAEPITPQNLLKGKLIPGSISPDKKFCLLEVFHSDTTQNSIVIATTDRTENLGQVGITTEWSTDIPHDERTTIVWNGRSDRVAIHDSLEKNSRLRILRLTEEGFTYIETEALLEKACSHFGIQRKAVASSGQIPKEWKLDDFVSIEVRVKLTSGKLMKHTFNIHAPIKEPSLRQ